MRNLASLAFCLLLSPCALASTLLVTGVVTQSPPDGTGPAVANPSLNLLQDGLGYQLLLTSPVDIVSPGTYALTDASLAFSVPGGAVTESAFSSISLTVTSNGGFSDFSLFACLAGADCISGNSLSASFRTAAISTGGMTIAATGLDQPHPLDLLEDDGTTDIQGSISTFSNSSGPSAVTPEPGTGSLAVVALTATALFGALRQRFNLSGRMR